ncbi:TRAUB-domain-containing protein [Choiromyces venosus 120613-1]|uniref:Protein BFR2 n=1 Tax=Choiromyces venosus 120613-1 TaxID=1336337 RepID=A0A3N4JLF5_9PEZI|nr:TRAUB-domain-containing protein [Choiromyces venosus 120613-1]
MTSSKPRNSLSLSEQLALLENPAPTDFDPEAPEEDYNHSEKSEGSGDEENEDLGRAHYITVGKSKLRKGNPVLSDPKYNGARISREKLYRDEDEDHRMDGSDDDSEDSDGDGSEEDADEKKARNRENGEIPTDEDDDIDSDDALGSDEDKFSGFKFLGSSTTKGGVKATRGMKVAGDSSSDGESGTDPDNDAILNEEKDTDEDDSSDVESDLLSHNEDGDEEDEDEDEDEDGEDEDESSDEGAQDADTKRREELKKLITEEQKNVVANISKAVKADTEKGTAVKQQQKIFDSLLGVRIKLQKAIVAANSLPAPSQPAPSHQPVSETYKAAEDAALNLWNTLTDLRCELSSSSALKRKHDDADTSTSALWAKMQKLEGEVHINRLSTLDKWSAKTSSVSTGTLARKLNNTAQRGLTATISETLMTDLNRHVQKTRVPRSCAPTKVGSGEDVEVYDDSDFYQMLLKALVDQRMVDNANSGGASGAIRWTTALRDAKVKKVVDTKASKGRKLKYQVQEKLQNFIAPIANNSWNEHQIDELFGSLLGQRVRVDEDSEEEEEVELDGLRLFKS